MLPFSLRQIPEDLRDPSVVKAMEAVPRERFVPPHLLEEARKDTALPIGWGQTISQPLVVFYMTAGLRVRPGKKVLEIGTGSGYQTAILAAMGVEVYTIELIPELMSRAERAIKSLKLPGEVHFRCGDGWHGWASAAPFDGIIATAAPGRIPPAFIEQLSPSGRLVIPVGEGETQTLRVLERTADGLEEKHQLPVRFVPLVRAEPEA
ncbi:MAG: protein-L-isoaspartate(D-aspartate) O-methyltransferase [Myxococcota bacterium]